MRALFLLPLLFACSPPPDCVSSGGLELHGSASCESLSVYEGKMLDAFEHHVKGWDRAAVSEAIRGLEVHISPNADESGSMYSQQHKQHVGGYAECWAQAVIVGTDDWERSALTHEVAHFLQGCMDMEHATWQARGIWRAEYESKLADGEEMRWVDPVVTEVGS